MPHHIMQELKALNKVLKQERKLHTCEVLTTQPELLSSYVLKELQDAYNPEHIEEEPDQEGLTICEENQNAEYDLAHSNDEAAKWLTLYGSF